MYDQWLKVGYFYWHNYKYQPEGQIRILSSKCDLPSQELLATNGANDFCWKIAEKLQFLCPEHFFLDVECKLFWQHCTAFLTRGTNSFPDILTSDLYYVRSLQFLCFLHHQRLQIDIYSFPSGRPFKHRMLYKVRWLTCIATLKPEQNTCTR